jgi:hypothetical protein
VIACWRGNERAAVSVPETIGLQILAAATGPS